MKPVLGAWKFSQRAVAPLAFRNVWMTSGGTSTNVPARRLHLAQLLAEAEHQLALDDVERVHVLVMDVGIGAALAGFVAGPRDVDERMLEQRADRPLATVGHHLAVGSGQQHANRDPVSTRGEPSAHRRGVATALEAARYPRDPGHLRPRERRLDGGADAEDDRVLVGAPRDLDAHRHAGRFVPARRDAQHGTPTGHVEDLRRADLAHRVVRLAVHDQRELRVVDACLERRNADRRTDERVVGLEHGAEPLLDLSLGLEPVCEPARLLQRPEPAGGVRAEALLVARDDRLRDAAERGGVVRVARDSNQRSLDPDVGVLDGRAGVPQGIGDRADAGADRGDDRPVAQVPDTAMRRSRTFAVGVPMRSAGRIAACASGCGPDITSAARATSPTVRASGPT